jgi:hypothetical protein
LVGSGREFGQGSQTSISKLVGPGAVSKMRKGQSSLVSVCLAQM